MGKGNVVTFRTNLSACSETITRNMAYWCFGVTFTNIDWLPEYYVNNMKYGQVWKSMKVKFYLDPLPLFLTWIEQ